MRKLGLVLLVVGAAGLAGFVPAGSGHVDLSNCSASGSSASALVRDRTYLMQVFDEEVWVCWAASASTCGSGGRRFAAGFAGKVTITGEHLSVSCRSAGATGDVEFTRL